MKRLIIWAIIIVIILIVVLFLNNKEINNQNLISIEVNGNIQSNSADFYFNNNSEYEFEIEDNYEIFSLIGNQKKELEPISDNIVIAGIGKSIGKKAKSIININWEYKYGLLEKGKYLICFHLSSGNNKYDILTEFIIK